MVTGKFVRDGGGEGKEKSVITGKVVRDGGGEGKEGLWSQKGLVGPRGKEGLWSQGRLVGMEGQNGKRGKCDHRRVWKGWGQ